MRRGIRGAPTASLRFSGCSHIDLSRASCGRHSLCFEILDMSERKEAMNKKILLLAAVIMLVAAACGGSDDADEGVASLSALPTMR